MIKKTIEISRQPAYISAKHGQLLIQPYDHDKSAQSSIPAEDIGVMMVDQPQSTFSFHALSTLMDNGAAFVVCGHNHLPLGVMLPLSSHDQVVWRVKDQINASKPTLKRLWQQLVKAKIQAQAQLLNSSSAAYKQLQRLAKEVKTDDNTNNESQAARIYWRTWSNGGHDVNQQTNDTNIACINNHTIKQFRRDTNGEDHINAMLNYGYGILRAAVGRAIVSAGLFPAIGIHHRNRSNGFCLADDLMEPLRPMVDCLVADIVNKGYDSLDQTVKATLLNVLISPVKINGQKSPLMVCLHRMTASLVRCYQEKSKKLDIPIPITPKK